MAIDFSFGFMVDPQFLNVISLPKNQFFDKTVSKFTIFLLSVAQESILTFHLPFSIIFRYSHRIISVV